ncbi:MAG: site-2 protease family protein [Pirellula sp.]
MSAATTVPGRTRQLIRPKLRPDLSWVSYERNHRWVLHDPISNAFFYFDDIERRAALLLDGSRSLQQVADALSRFPIPKVRQPLWIESLANRLAAAGLLMPSGRPVPSGPTVGTWQRTLRSIASNPLAIRVPLLRPSGHSATAKSIAAVLFHPWVAILGCAALLAVSFVLLTRWLAQPEKLLFDIAHLQGDRWLALLATLMAIKTFHELGHYLACARWKVDCQEMGLMLLCFSPCLYCDTTNAWKLPSRWARAAISTGGIYVELWLAVLGGLMFLVSEDSLIRTLGAGMWMTCTIGTILLNGNPCFRYDGYYILSDLWGVPNLGPQSQEALWQSFIHLLGGRSPQPDAFDKPIWQLVLFALVSGVYRCLILATLIWFVWNLLVPNGLGILALLVIGSLALGMVHNVLRFSQGLAVESFSPQPTRRARVALFLAALGALGAAAFYLPIPSHMRSRGYVDLNDREPLFMHESALLTAVTAMPGAVSEGALIVECDSFELRKDWLQLKHKLDEVNTRIALLEKAQINVDEAAFELPTLREVRQELTSRFAIKQEAIEALRVKTSKAGTLIPASIPRAMPFEMGEPRWTRSPVFVTPPIGAAIDRGSVIGWLSADDTARLQVAVSASDVRWLQVGSPAEAILDSQPHLRWPCRVTRISPEPLPDVPPALIGDPGIVSIRNEQGRLRFEAPHYGVTLEPITPLRGIAVDAAATIHFELPGKPLVQTLWEGVRQGLQRP